MAERIDALRSNPEGLRGFTGKVLDLEEADAGKLPEDVKQSLFRLAERASRRLAELALSAHRGPTDLAHPAPDGLDAEATECADRVGRQLGPLAPATVRCDGPAVVLALLR